MHAEFWKMASSKSVVATNANRPRSATRTLGCGVPKLSFSGDRDLVFAKCLDTLEAHGCVRLRAQCVRVRSVCSLEDESSSSKNDVSLARERPCIVATIAGCPPDGVALSV